jgi:hypothetical protein
MEVQFHALNFGRVISRKRAPGVHWLEGWFSTRAGLVILEERNKVIPAYNRNPIPWSSINGTD